MLSKPTAPLSSLIHLFGSFGQILQTRLFLALREERDPLSDRNQEFVRALALLGLEGFVARRRGRGRPSQDRVCIARAFLAKAVFNFPTTRALLDRLAHDEVLRRLCGWGRKADIPKEWTVSRAFEQFASSEFPQQVHAALIERTQSERLVGHLFRDATAIQGREKRCEAKPVQQPPTGRRRHRKASASTPPENMTRLERQHFTMPNLEAMLEDLPRQCDLGCKPDSSGRKNSWTGYKLHVDVADGQIPISCILTSASLNDSQVAIPLAEMSARRVTNCYDVMDTGYTALAIRLHSEKLGHVPIIGYQKRGGEEKKILAPHEKSRMRERSVVERVFSRLKDEYGADHVRVRGNAKVMAHLMFGILALTADQVLRWAGIRETEPGEALA